MQAIRPSSSSLLTIGLQGINRSNRMFAQSAERLATGLRINRGSDDPSGLIASEHLGSDLTSLHSQMQSLERENLDLNIEAADASIERQAEIGMEQRSNESRIRAMEEQSINTAAARSQIRDTDYADEISNSMRASILNKASMRVMLIAQEQSKRSVDLLG
jgi:flagellin